MKPNNLHSFFYSSSLVCLLLISFSFSLRAAAPAVDSGEPLTKILERLGEKYQVLFSYNIESLKKIEVDFEFRPGEDLESAINRLLEPTNFKYESFGDKYYVVYEKSREGTRTSRKLRKYIKKIHQLEKRGKISLQRMDHTPSEQLGGVVHTTQQLAERAAKRKKRNMVAEVRGVVTEAATGNPLISATVMIRGTSIGDVTDVNGEYRITGIPAGEHTLMVSYIGYQTDSVRMTFEDGQSYTQDFDLAPAATVLTEEVVVLGQREGQAAAINQQVKSNQIVNVVSAERIQELPDENAAESVGRLPGISVRRSGGEGQRVNIRGLSPKFSNVSLDGVRIPATGQGRQVFRISTGQGSGAVSPSVDDRSVDLSMISSEALAGIEVYKSLTPDQDGDAIGGKVNFVTRKASRGAKYRINVMGGANPYHETFNNLKTTGTYSNRFFNNKLGVLANGGYSNIDRSSDINQVNYDLRGGGVVLNGFALEDRVTRRQRYNGSLALDYELGERHSLTFNGMYARTDVDSDTRRLSIGSLNNNADYSASENKSNINLYNGSLGAIHQLGFMDVDWKVTYIETVDESPYNYGFNFNEQSPLTNTELPRLDPYLTAEYTSFNAVEAFGGIPGGGSTTRREDRNWVAQLNMKKPFKIGLNTTGFFKWGGKLTSKDRTRRTFGNTLITASTFIDAYLKDHPEAVIATNQLAAVNFLDDNFDIGQFFRGEFPFPIILDAEAPKRLFDEYRHLRVDRIRDGLEDYDANENIYAGYVMADFNISNRIFFVGGVRYEHFDSRYKANVIDSYGETLASDGTVVPSGKFESATSGQNYGEWLPMANIKFNVLQSADNNNGLDVRLAATRSLTRPDFYNLTPYVRIRRQGNSIRRSEPDLLPTTAWNYDAFVTLYNNKFGLFTIGGFYKELQNIDFLYGREVERDVIDDRFGEEFGIVGGYAVIEPLNALEPTSVLGIELEIQTNLSFLPSPLDGIVLYGNYSRINTEASYPQRVSFFDLETFTSVLYDSTRVNRMPGQSRDIANLALGYDKGGFSGRVSYSFQGAAIDFIGANEELDGWIDDFARLDVSMNYKLNQNITFMANGTNLLNSTDRTFFGPDRLPGNENIFGPTLWFGIRYSGSGR